MRIESHLKKIKRFERTIAKLNLEEDSETLIGDFMLASSHFINAAMHKLETLREDRDIKHNNLFGFIKGEKSLREKSEELADLIQQIEQLRPSYVYGKGENGNTARKAKEAFEKIKNICNKILKGKDERKFKNSN